MSKKCVKLGYSWLCCNSKSVAYNTSCLNRVPLATLLGVPGSLLEAEANEEVVQSPQSKDMQTKIYQIIHNFEKIKPSAAAG